MSLLCALGRHSPGGMPRWNDGYYFARCRRCGCDLVRTAYQKWHVPEGYRVVWSAEPPSEQPEIDVSAAPEPAALSLDEPAFEAAEPAIASHEEEVLAEPVPDEIVPPDPIDEALAAVTSEPEPTLSEPPIETSPPELAEPEPAIAEPLGEIAPVEPEPAITEPFVESLSAAPSEPEPVEPAIETPAAESAEPEPTMAAEPAPETRAAFSRLPISEVLDRLRAEESEPSIPPPASASRPAPRVSPSWSEDFMKDDPDDELVIGPPDATMPERRLGRSDPFGRPLDEEDDEPLLARAAAGLRDIFHAIRDRVRRAGERPPRPLRVIGAAILVSGLVAAIVILISPSPAVVSERLASLSSAPDDSHLLSLPQAAPPRSQPVDGSGIVTASVLSCRAAPSTNASRLRNLLTGQRVEIVARAAGWLALANHGGRCWVEDRFVAAKDSSEG